MLKKISEMTDKDKAVFLEKTKRAMTGEQGIPWEIVESKILEAQDHDALRFVIIFCKKVFLSWSNIVSLPHLSSS